MLALWNKCASFPVKFKRLEGFTDESRQFIEQQLLPMTPLVHDIFQHLYTNSMTNLILNFLIKISIDLYLMEKEIRDLFLSIGIRGFMTMLGFRKTVGSQDLPWPSKQFLVMNFNKLHTVLGND